MHSVIEALVAAASVATPSPSGTAPVDPELVTPGFWGFAAIGFVAFAVVFLVWDMLRRIRRAKYRSEIDEELDAEQDAATEHNAATEQDPPPVA